MICSTNYEIMSIPTDGYKTTAYEGMAVTLGTQIYSFTAGFDSFTIMVDKEKAVTTSHSPRPTTEVKGAVRRGGRGRFW